MVKHNKDVCKVYGTESTRNGKPSLQKLITVPKESNIKIGSYVRLVPVKLSIKEFRGK